MKQRNLFGEPEKADHSTDGLRAPFPYFGGKRGLAGLIWYAFGEAKQYIEPFCGSAAVLLANPKPAPLEVVGDINLYIANFWRAVKHQPDAVAAEADYPVSHIDLAARHRWLVEPERVAEMQKSLTDPEWPGDAKIAGWWCWGQCAWIGSGWCEPCTDRPTDRPTKSLTSPTPGEESSQLPFVGHSGRGLQRNWGGQIPFLNHAGMGIHSGARAHLQHTGRVPSRERERERARRFPRSRTQDAACSVGVPLTAPSCGTGCMRSRTASNACASSTAPGSAA